MATPKKLPSGKWRIRVYDKETGKTRSFTADTKRKANLLAMEWQEGKRESHENGLTIGEAVDKYIDGRDGVLSPKTISEYRKMRTNYINGDFSIIPVKNVTQPIIQAEVNKLSKTVSVRTHRRISPKTVKNFHGLLSGAIREQRPDFVLNTSLPVVPKKFIELPPVENVINAVKGTDIELPAMLAMWLSLSASEIRGISVDAIKDSILTIKESVVQVDGVAVHKDATKAFERTRRLSIPTYIMGLIKKTEAFRKGEGYIETRSGKAISCRFMRIIKEAGIEHMTFHQLRHMNASVMAMLNVPEKYAQERGGWKTPHTMKRVYQHTFSQERQNVDRKIDQFFEQAIGTVK